jgi:hypothetical protein
MEFLETGSFPLAIGNGIVKKRRRTTTRRIVLETFGHFDVPHLKFASLDEWKARTT